MLVEKAMRGQIDERFETFEANKAIAAIGYLVQKTGAELYAVMKMLYLADKAHLEAYGRTVTGDVYTAMRRGPVPERAYNLCKFIRGDRAHFDPAPDARERLGMDGHAFRLLTPPDLLELSKTDLRALDSVIEIYQAGGWSAVANASHDRAWNAAWDVAQSRGVGSIDMEMTAIAASLPNGPELIEFMADAHPGEADYCH